MKVDLQIWVLILGFLACQETPYVQGKRLYEYHCSGCHMSDGQGMKSLYPRIDSSDFLNKNTLDLACLIRRGRDNPPVVNSVSYDVPMPGNAELTEAEISNICNYIFFRWYPQLTPVSESQVRKQLAECTE